MTLGSRGASVARGFLLLAIVLAVYRPVFDAGFLHDDGDFVAANQTIQRGGRGFGAEARAGLGELWFPDLTSPAYGSLPGTIVPVTATVYWLEWRWFGSDEPGAAPDARGVGAPGYHVVNVLLHAACAALLWRVLRRLSLPGAWFAALLWAVHPVCVESVAWIAEQRNTLAMAFALASGAAWLRWSETGRRADWVWSLVAFLLALLSKPAVVPVPIVLVLIGWWRRRPLGAEVRAALPFLGLSLATGLLEVVAENTYAIGSEQIPVGSPVERIYRASFALGFYAWKALLPFDLIAIYPRWHDTLPWTIQLVPGLVVAGLLAASWRARERWGRAVIVGVAGFAAMLAPALGFVPMAYMRHTLVADHFAYFALPFPIALLVGSAATGFRSWRAPRIGVISAAAAVAILLAVQTTRYATTFHDKRTLWTRTLERNPSAWLANAQLGALLTAEGRPGLALAHLERAAELAPLVAEPHNNLAVALERLGRRKRALAEIQKAAALSPGDPYVRLNCANGLLGAGRPREALPHFEAAFGLLARRQQPEDPAVRVSYGAALLQSGRPRAAVDQLQRVLAQGPNPAARRLLADAQHVLETPSAPPGPGSGARGSDRSAP
jgi:Flp pilus assembly protein TadD